MKEVKAIIQPFMLDRVLGELEAIEGVPGAIISRVEGWGRSPAERAREAGHASAHKTKLEIVVDDDLAPAVVAAIARAAHSGNVGDGKIFVIDVAEVVKIRTGERGRAAI